MNNIMKALNYQTRRDNFTVYVILACVVSFFVFFFAPDTKELNGGMTAVFYGDCMMMMLVIVPLGMTTRICGWDYADKTMNYEILSGHKRKDIYWGRFLVSMSWVTAITYIFLVIPLIVMTIINGWGDNLDLKNLIIRYALLIFPLFRSVCEYTLLTFIIKNGYLSLIFGFILADGVFGITMLLDEFNDIKTTVWITLTNFTELVTFSNYTFGYVNGEDICVYESALEPSVIIGTIAVSLIAGFICLFGGYLYFKKSDVN